MDVSLRVHGLERLREAIAEVLEPYGMRDEAFRTEIRDGVEMRVAVAPFRFDGRSVLSVERQVRVLLTKRST